MSIENIHPLLLTDFYKTGHIYQYPKGTTKVYSNFTARKSRIPGVNHVIWFGLSYFLQEYLDCRFNDAFFSRPEDAVVDEYLRLTDNTLGKGAIKEDHIRALHKLGYLPVRIKALPEGTKVPIKVPCLTVTNTLPEFFWLPNFLETILSACMWQACTSATLAHEFRQLLDKWADKTGGPKDFVPFQGHDFSFRGMSSLETACLSGAGHLLSFVGTDTIPAIMFLEKYYAADVQQELVGTSVPATEHSVMCMGTQGDELGTFKRLITEVYPSGIVSIVSDTWDLWKVLTEYLPALKDVVLARDGKVVIRPDSGDPVDIICGKPIYDFSHDKYCPKDDIEAAKEYFKQKVVDRVRDVTPHGQCGDSNPREVFKYGNKYYNVEVAIAWNRYDKQYYFMDGEKLIRCDEIKPSPADKGVIGLLWEVFGGTINDKGFKELDSHIGAIYGDSISLERAEQISSRLAAKGFASTNIVYGIGSYTYQYNTRDTQGWAMKATYGEITSVCQDDLYDQGGPSIGQKVVECREIFKSPVTDDGTKKSAKGLLCVHKGEDGEPVMYDQCTEEQEESGELKTVFEDGKILVIPTLAEIRARLSSQ